MTTIDWARFFFLGWGLSFTTYVVLQISVTLLSRGRLRWLALTPAPFVALILMHAIAKYHATSSLWPVLLIIGSASAALFCIVMMGVALIARRKAGLTDLWKQHNV